MNRERLHECRERLPDCKLQFLSSQKMSATAVSGLYKWLCSPQLVLLWFSLLSQAQWVHWPADKGLCGTLWHLVALCTAARWGTLQAVAPQRSLRDFWQDFLLTCNSLVNSTTDAFCVIPYSKEVIKQPAKASVLRLPTGGCSTEFWISLPHHHSSLLPMVFPHANFNQEMAGPFLTGLKHHHFHTGWKIQASLPAGEDLTPCAALPVSPQPLSCLCLTHPKPCRGWRLQQNTTDCKEFSLEKLPPGHGKRHPAKSCSAWPGPKGEESTWQLQPL